MARRNSPKVLVFPNPIGNHGRIVLALFSIGFLAVNLCVAYFVMRHAYPMLVYPAFAAFLTVYFLFRRHLPSRSTAIGFIIACECIVILSVICMASSNHFLVDFWKLLEPTYFLPSILVYFAVGKVSDPRKEVASTFLVVGGLFVVLSFISMIPGNPVVSLLENPPGGGFALVDAYVPAAVIRDLFLYYHLPMVLGSFGSTALLYGIVEFYTDMRITDLGFFALIIAIVFSLYAFGVAIVWQVYAEQGSRENESVIPPSSPA